MEGIINFIRYLFGMQYYFKGVDAVAWFKSGNLHREDGPAVEFFNGNKSWYLNGKLHREDGPAREYLDGQKEWWMNGEPHRIDGPAVECPIGYKEWWMNGNRLTEQEFEEKAFQIRCQRWRVL